MRFVAGIIVILVCLLAAGLMIRDLLPPARLTFAAGPRDGGYWAMAERYREILARDKIEVEIIPTAGSVENLALLSAGQAQAALLQGGIPAGGHGLKSLGTVFVEPILVFARSGVIVPANPAFWKGIKIAGGEEGSGTRLVVGRFLERIGVAPPVNDLVPIGGKAATDALLAGEVDLAIFIAPVEAGYLRPLFASQDVQIVALDHADAISMRLGQSEVATVPSGVISLDPVLPAEDLSLIVLPARLVAEQKLHPALVDRLVQAAIEIHGEASVFAREGQYPSIEGSGLPTDTAALKLITEGPGFFHSWLPYWMAAQFRRMLLVLLPLVFVVVPLVRSLPSLYAWSMRRRVWRHYNQIRAVEFEISRTPDAAGLRQLDRRLQALDGKLAEIPLPPAFRERAYNARLHIDLLRRGIAARLETMEAEPSTA